MLRSKLVNYLPGNSASSRVRRSKRYIFSDYKTFNEYDRRRVDGRSAAAATQLVRPSWIFVHVLRTQRAVATVRPAI